mgnify:CR=1 FL=1|jgi:hypothetical protein
MPKRQPVLLESSTEDVATSPRRFGRVFWVVFVLFWQESWVDRFLLASPRLLVLLAVGSVMILHFFVTQGESSEMGI